MKKLLIALGLGVLLMGTTALAVQPEGVPVENENNGAVIINKDVCIKWIKVPGENDLIRSYGESVHVVMNKNMIKTICTGEVPAEDLDGLELPLKENDFKCKVLTERGERSSAMVTYDSKFILTPSGQARLECTYTIPVD